MKNKSSILSLVHLINFPKILIIISILLSIIGSVSTFSAFIYSKNNR